MTALAFILGNWQRFALYGVVAVVLLGAAWFHGYTRGELKLAEYKADQAKAAVVIVTKQGAITERVVTKYIKVKEASQNVAEGIKREIIKYVETHPGSCLDRQWGRLHDSAALGTVPTPASVADGTAGAPAAAAAIQTVTENYGACRRNAERLGALQEWVREQARP